MQLLPPPGPQRTRQLTLLGLLVVVLIGYWMYQPGARQRASTTPAATPQPGKPGAPAGSILPPPVRLNALGTPGENAETGRNPFRFGTPPPPPPAPAPAYVAPPQPVEPPAPPPPPPWPPPIQLTLSVLWVDEQTGMRGATLHDPKTNALYQVYQGSTIDGRYKVQKIGEQTVVVSYLDGSGLKTLTKR